MPETSKILVSAVLSFLLFVSFSCNSGSTETEPPKPDSPTEPSQNNVSAEKIKIKSADGSTVAEISANGQIDFGGKKLTSYHKNAEKVIFSLDGKEIAEVKTKDADGFKVRDLSGKLLWKIKITPDKIKISDNEENANAFEIKKKDDGAKIVQNETDLGKVKFDADGQKVKVKNAAEVEIFESRTDSRSMAFAVLLLDKIPEEHRFIIMSEIFSRNL